jgi:anthranilate/para-aminobenzoate synthase component II
MGIESSDLKLFGLQFHPESIASENGIQLLNTFLKTC